MPSVLAFRGSDASSGRCCAPVERSTSGCWRSSRAFVIGLWFLLSGDRGWALIVAVLAIGPASTLAVAVVNRAVTRSLGPRPLPRLDLDDGVPSELRTLVAVPMLLTSAADVDEQVAALEVHYLGNREGDLRFALLSDWLDADSEHADGDDELLAVAAAGIDRLNERYGDAPGGGARFLLFHRGRRGTRARTAGWVGSASAASSRS